MVVNDCTENHAQVGEMRLVHATGFHGRCWDQIIRLLPDQHIIAVEMRSHGRSDNAGPMTWKTLSNDLADVIAMPAER